jgi:hypothetical protein
MFWRLVDDLANQLGQSRKDICGRAGQDELLCETVFAGPLEQVCFALLSRSVQCRESTAELSDHDAACTSIPLRKRLPLPKTKHASGVTEVLSQIAIP